MSLRGLRIAAAFLTRIPLPSIAEVQPAELSRAAGWFPLIGAAVGAAVLAVLTAIRHLGLWFGAADSLLAAATGLLAWIWLTGALHLDGLADLVDALAASHRDPARFLQVLADPHLGTFGAVAVVAVVILKLAALTRVADSAPHALILIAAWARLGPLVWAQWLRPLKPGHGARFAQRLRPGWIAAWTIALLLLSALVAPVLCVAPVLLVAFSVWLRWRVGGQTGDCLGAGVEITESALLLALAIAGPAGALHPTFWY
jgi:adenosylcobinamide-GDP ribazoletransferase